MPQRAPLRLVRAALCSLGCIFWLSACAKQSEGERCDINSGNLDCDTGLVCRSSDQLSIEDGRGVALCCPIQQALTRVDACRAGGAELPEETEPPLTPADAGSQQPAVDAGNELPATDAGT